MTGKKRFFVANSNQYAPDKFLVPGSILANFTDPETSLNYKNIVTPPSIQEPTVEYDSYKSLNTSYRMRFGIFASWMDRAGLRLGYKKEGQNGESWHFEKLEKILFTPDRAYVEQALRTPEVEEYIKEKQYSASLFMVTGIQVARGARQHSSKGSSGGPQMLLSIDGAAVGAPGVSAGPQAEFQSTNREVSGFGSSTDFVYAWRVKRIKYRQTKFVMKDVKGEAYGKQSDEQIEERRFREQRRIADGGDFTSYGLDPEEVEVGGMECEEIVDDEKDEQEGECEIVWVGES